jgi:hypothetical protein
MSFLEASYTLEAGTSRQPSNLEWRRYVSTLVPDFVTVKRRDWRFVLSSRSVVSMLTLLYCIDVMIGSTPQAVKQLEDMLGIDLCSSVTGEHINGARL